MDLARRVGFNQPGEGDRVNNQGKIKANMQNSNVRLHQTERPGEKRHEGRGSRMLKQSDFEQSPNYQQPTKGMVTGHTGSRKSMDTGQAPGLATRWWESGGPGPLTRLSTKHQGPSVLGHPSQAQSTKAGARATTARHRNFDPISQVATSASNKQITDPRLSMAATGSIAGMAGMALGATTLARPRTSRPDQGKINRISSKYLGLNHDFTKNSLVDQFSANKVSRAGGVRLSQQSTTDNNQPLVAQSSNFRAQSNYQNRNLANRRQPDQDAAASKHPLWNASKALRSQRAQPQIENESQPQAYRTQQATARSGKSGGTRGAHRSREFKSHKNQPSNTPASTLKVEFLSNQDPSAQIDQAYNFTTTTKASKGGIWNQQGDYGDQQQPYMAIGLKKKIGGQSQAQSTLQHQHKQKISKYETRNLLQNKHRKYRLRRASQLREPQKGAKAGKGELQQTETGHKVSGPEKQQPPDEAKKEAEPANKTPPRKKEDPPLNQNAPRPYNAHGRLVQIVDGSDYQPAPGEHVAQPGHVTEVSVASKSVRSRSRNEALRRSGSLPGDCPVQRLSRDSKNAVNGTQSRKLTEDPQRLLHTVEITETCRVPKEEDNVGTESKKDKRNESGGRPLALATPLSPISPPDFQQRIFGSAQQNPPDVKQQNIANGQNNIAGADQNRQPLAHHGEQPKDKRGNEPIKKNRRNAQAKIVDLLQDKNGRQDSQLEEAAQNEAESAPSERRPASGSKPNRRQADKKPIRTERSQEERSRIKDDYQGDTLKAYADSDADDRSDLKFDKNDFDQKMLMDQASGQSDTSLMSLGLGLGIKIPKHLAQKYRLKSAAVSRPAAGPGLQKDGQAPGNQCQSLAQLQLAPNNVENQGNPERAMPLSLPASAVGAVQLKTQQIQFYYSKGFEKASRAMSSRMKNVQADIQQNKGQLGKQCVVALQRLIRASGRSSHQELVLPMKQLKTSHSLTRNNFLVSTKDLIQQQQPKGEDMQIKPQKRLQSAHPTNLAQQKQSFQHFLQSKKTGLKLSDLMPAPSQDQDAFTLTHKQSDHNQGLLPSQVQKVQNSNSLKYLGRLNHPSSKNIDIRGSLQNAQGGETVKLLTLDPSLKDRLHYPPQSEQYNEVKVLRMRKYCPGLGAADHGQEIAAAGSDYRTLNQTSSKKKIGMKRQLNQPSVMNQNPLESQNKLLLIGCRDDGSQPEKSGEAGEGKDQELDIQSREEEVWLLNGDLARSPEGYRIPHTSPGGAENSLQCHPSAQKIIDRKTIHSVDSRSRYGTDRNPRQLASPGTSPSPHRELHSQQNLTASRKSVLKKVYRKESTQDEQQIITAGSNGLMLSYQQNQQMLISDYEESPQRGASQAEAQKGQMDEQRLEKDQLQVEFLSHKHQTMTNIKISPKSRSSSGEKEAQLRAQLRQEDGKPKLRLYARNSNQTRDRMMNQLVNALDNGKESAIFPAGYQQLPLVTRQPMKSSNQNFRVSTRGARDYKSSARNTATSPSKPKLETVINQRDSQRQRYLAQAERIQPAKELQQAEQALRKQLSQRKMSPGPKKEIQSQKEPMPRVVGQTMRIENQAAKKKSGGLNGSNDFSGMGEPQEAHGQGISHPGERSNQNVQGRKQDTAKVLPASERNAADGTSGPAAGKSQAKQDPPPLRYILADGQKKLSEIAEIVNAREAINNGRPAKTGINQEDQSTQLNANKIGSLPQSPDASGIPSRAVNQVKEPSATNGDASPTPLAKGHSVPSLRSHDRNNKKQMQEIADRFDRISQDDYTSRSRSQYKSGLSGLRTNKESRIKNLSPGHEEQHSHPPEIENNDEIQQSFGINNQDLKLTNQEAYDGRFQGPPKFAAAIDGVMPVMIRGSGPSAKRNQEEVQQKEDNTKNQHETNKNQIDKFCNLFEQINNDPEAFNHSNKFSQTFVQKMEHHLNQEKGIKSSSKSSKNLAAHLPLTARNQQLGLASFRNATQRNLRDPNDYYIKKNIGKLKILSARNRKEQRLWELNKLQYSCQCQKGKQIDENQRKAALGLSFGNKYKQKQNQQQIYRFPEAEQLDEFRVDTEFVNEHFATFAAGQDQHMSFDPQNQGAKVIISNRAETPQDQEQREITKRSQDHSSNLHEMFTQNPPRFQRKSTLNEENQEKPAQTGKSLQQYDSWSKLSKISKIHLEAPRGPHKIPYVSQSELKMQIRST